MSRICLFGCSVSTEMPDGSVKYENIPITADEAIQILVHNGWTEELAKEDLSRCPDQWILVNSHTQIC